MLSIIKKTFIKFLEDKCPVFSAALAYYSVLSIPPLFIIIITACSFFGIEQENIQGQIRTQIINVIGSEGADQIMDMIRAARERGKGMITTIVSLFILIFGSTAVFVQLQIAMNQIWHVEPDPKQGGIKNFTYQRLASFAIIFVLAFLLLISLVLSTILFGMSTVFTQVLNLDSSLILFLVNETISLIIFFLLFSAIFKFLPDAIIGWRQVWFGAFVTASMFLLGKFFIGWFLGERNLGETYGPAGSLVMVLMWVYFSSMILFLGAEFTKVWAERYGKPIKPAKGALRVIEKKIEVERTKKD